MHTQWCTHVTVTNSDLQTRKKQSLWQKIPIDKICEKNCNKIIDKWMTKPS